MRWQLLLKQIQSQTVIYIYQRETNIMADAFNRLPIATSATETDVSDQNVLSLADHFRLNDSDLPDDIYPLFSRHP
jgi:hypothetical protein